MRFFKRPRSAACVALLLFPWFFTSASYVNFESSHVHPIALTPLNTRLLVVNTPDALLEVFVVEDDGSLTAERTIPVGLEPVTVAARTETEAWVVNNLSDSVSIVDLSTGVVTRTLSVGDEPTDVVFTATHAFVAVSQEDAVKRYTLANLDAAPTVVTLFSRDVRALARSASGSEIYAVTLRSGNQTTVVSSAVIFNGNNTNLNGPRLTALGLRDFACSSTPPAYPALPTGIVRNPALTDPPASANPAEFPPVGLIVRWDDVGGQWTDDDGTSWNDCLPYRLPDKDLFIIDATTMAITDVAHLGTSLFDVSVHPTNQKIYIPNTEARNHVRFEHPLGVQGHVVDNRLTVVDPLDSNSVNIIDLNAHIDRNSDPANNVAERTASISQPGMMTWKADGSVGYLTAIGTRKLFRVDGTCTTAACIFGADRAAPAVVEVGEGPTGVALNSDDDRLYVLNRISHSLTVVQASTMTVQLTVDLHDPSSPSTRNGRRFLYDAIIGSGHGDAACSSCHLSGDMDGLGWDLGNPAGSFVSYDEPLDNVRFVVPQGGQPVECDSAVCAAHDGFDPQKGPMVTQTLRGMLEPLHWRGDRATMNDFNGAFPDLMGTADIGPINGKAAGLSAVDMESFRQFALAMSFPPNPFRNIDDTTPCGTRAGDPGCQVLAYGSSHSGNPTEGALLFDTASTDAGQPCVACHSHPFGAGGGKLNGVTPVDPVSSDAAALFFGTADGSLHSDLKIPHLRNMYDKLGPLLPPPAASPIDTANGFGYSHDGAFPDMFRFFSSNVFTLSATDQAQEVRDIVSFMFHFPTSIKPSVGVQVTVPAGTPPTGSAADELTLTTLLSLGDLANVGRHCELYATTVVGGVSRSYHLNNSQWVPDAMADPPLSSQSLREGAGGPITFTCATLGAGTRLGGDRDQDAVLNLDDCAGDDGGAWAVPTATVDLVVVDPFATTLTWTDQAPSVGDGIVYDVLGGDLSTLTTTGVAGSTCVESGLPAAMHLDPRPNPSVGDGYFYLIRGRNRCGQPPAIVSREALDALDCS
ncbi:MAG: hypothetical protein OEV00_03790 [Acidobacteriota bacterium]|nr:hypothetical protein [Acidobacteriota bacterium]MDH3784433.1 hypothetical protein [Acidobacteriota bacterium]